jgi:hypothetical protein
MFIKSVMRLSLFGPNFLLPSPCPSFSCSCGWNFIWSQVISRISKQTNSRMATLSHNILHSAKLCHPLVAWITVQADLPVWWCWLVCPINCRQLLSSGFQFQCRWRGWGTHHSVFDAAPFRPESCCVSSSQKEPKLHCPLKRCVLLFCYLHVPILTQKWYCLFAETRFFHDIWAKFQFWNMFKVKNAAFWDVTPRGIYYKLTFWRNEWVEYLHRSPASRKRPRKWNPVSGGLSGPPCSWGI